ncbi:DUF4318 domain-containing protein [Lachnospiraceae bacterium 54-53]
MFKLLKNSFAIPYDNNLKCPSVSEARICVANYCDENKLLYEFKDVTKEGSPIVKIDGKDYEVRFGYGIGQCGPGGYGISCREL